MADKPPRPPWLRPTREEITVFGAEALGVSPSDYISITGEESIGGENLGILGRHSARASVRQLPPLRGQRRPIALSAEGRRGETVDINYMPHNRFKLFDLHATDNSPTPGRRTRIQHIFVGQIRQIEDIPTWMFSEWMDNNERAVCQDAVQLLGTSEETASVREAARRLRMVDAVKTMSWLMWQPGLPVQIRLAFDADCRWDGVFWGDEAV